MAQPTGPETFFAGSPLGLAAFERVRALIARHGPVDVRVGRSQVAFHRGRGFAWLWRPGQYLRNPAAEVVVSIALPERDPSPRWKEVVQPSPGRWMHHLELRDLEDIDDEVAGWLERAWLAAGPHSRRRRAG
jgi:hypothetical protein